MTKIHASLAAKKQAILFINCTDIIMANRVLKLILSVKEPKITLVVPFTKPEPTEAAVERS